jgi:hypothetical protein
MYLLTKEGSPGLTTSLYKYLEYLINAGSPEIFDFVNIFTYLPGQMYLLMRRTNWHSIRPESFLLNSGSNFVVNGI